MNFDGGVQKQSDRGPVGYGAARGTEAVVREVWKIHPYYYFLTPSLTTFFIPDLPLDRISPCVSPATCLYVDDVFGD